MSSSAPPRSAAGADAPKRKVSFVRNVMKNKHNFIQFFAMTGILLLSMRSLGQKYRIHGLLEDNATLEDENKTLSDRMGHIKSGLFHEASLDSTGVFASRLKALFAV
ncbi:hypothetical protein V2J09_018082 [Rumex salicifolius]